MTLDGLIRALEEADQSYTAPIGLGRPHSHRGDYSQLAFSPAENVSVSEMLGHARDALGSTFFGWKGGEFVMHGYVYCYLDHEGEADGDRIGPALMAYMTGQFV